MKSLLDALPGLPMRVREVTHTMIHMWDQSVGEEGPPMSDFRASQMNLVLHFGPGTSAEEAKQRFDQGIAFAQRYPCRIIVLAESGPGQKIEELKGKLFSQCYVGRDLRDLCCCEALMLAYPQELADLVAHQASLWLEADLPVYYWLHREPAEVAALSFGTLLKQARRVIFDRNIDGGHYGSLATVASERKRDLAYARTLRLRQSLGQIASAYSPEELIADLVRVEVRCPPDALAEAAFLLDWAHGALQKCAALTNRSGEVSYELIPDEGNLDRGISMAWVYDARPEKSFVWEYHPRERSGQVRANLGGGPVQQPIHIEPLSAAQELAEAMFFA